MPTVTEKITTYAYEFRAVSSSRVALLSLFGGKRQLCFATFEEGEATLPAPKESPNGLVYLSLRYRWLDEVIDMLRSEKPVYFTWDRSSQTARIATDAEPVGEWERPAA